MTSEFTHDISRLLFQVVLLQLSILVVIATSQICHFSWVLQLPSSSLATQPRLEQLLNISPYHTLTQVIVIILYILLCVCVSGSWKRDLMALTKKI